MYLLKRYIFFKKTLLNVKEILPTSRDPCVFKKDTFPYLYPFLTAGITNEHTFTFSSVWRSPMWISLCGHGGVGGAVFLLQDLGVFFLGVAARLACGPSSHFSPTVAHVLTSPSPAVTLLTPSLTSEDAWTTLHPHQ